MIDIYLISLYMHIMSNYNMANEIEKVLRNSFTPTILQIQNDSHLHAGHQHFDNPGETHFSIYIEALILNDKSLVQKHKMILKALEPLFLVGLHSISIKNITLF